MVALSNIFNLKNIHPHDLATALDLDGIEVRAMIIIVLSPLMASPLILRVNCSS